MFRLLGLLCLILSPATPQKNLTCAYKLILLVTTWIVMQEFHGVLQWIGSWAGWQSFQFSSPSILVTLNFRMAPEREIALSTSLRHRVFSLSLIMAVIYGPLPQEAVGGGKCFIIWVSAHLPLILTCKNIGLLNAKSLHNKLFIMSWLMIWVSIIHAPLLTILFMDLAQQF